MRRKQHKKIWAALSAALLLAGICRPILACGLNWAEPKSHFEGVSFQGYVFLVEDLGNIELKDGKKLPVRAIFRSESNSTSPYLGHGWELPLLESHIVQMDERWFRVVEPTGWYRLFWRDEKDPTILHGQGNWKGTIRGNTISVMADCGDRLDFREGKISGMQLKGQKLEIERSSDGMAILKDHSMRLLAVQKNQSKEGINLKLGRDQTVEIGYADRPLIEVINGKAVVGRQVKSLGEIGKADGGKVPVKWGVDEKLNPTMQLGGRKLIWHPTTRYIIVDNDWNYEIKAGEGLSANAAIGRTNSKGENEFWHHDKAKGKGVIKKVDGIMKIKTWFISGKLAGKLREERIEKNGNLLRIEKHVYNENAMLVRINNEVNHSIYKADYNEGKLVGEAFEGRSSSIMYENNQQIITTTMPSGRVIVRKIDKNGKMVNFTIKHPQLSVIENH